MMMMICKSDVRDLFESRKKKEREKSMLTLCLTKLKISEQNDARSIESCVRRSRERKL